VRRGPAAADGDVDRREVELVEDTGETLVTGRDVLDRPAWHRSDR
jgi:hypothetical protein